MSLHDAMVATAQTVAILTWILVGVCVLCAIADAFERRFGP